VSEVIRRIPRYEIGGIVEVVVLDDASSDGTAEAAEAEGVIVFRSREKLGLARLYRKGLDEALRAGADIVVSIDADLQYEPAEIPKLCQLIVLGEADVVLGSRFGGRIEHMPSANRLGNRFLTSVVNRLIGTRLSDTQTGFRAFSREAAARLNVLSKYTHTQEVIIQASYKRMKIVEVPINFHRRNGKSRLIRSLPEYAFKAGVTVVLTYLHYWPLRGFSIGGMILVLLGLVAGIRPLSHFVATGNVSPYVPSSIVAGLLLTLGFLMFVVALLADMSRSNRELVEELLFREKYQPPEKS
jgi:glycosyltransferase involved in cell wall biosynthesis